MVRTGGVAERQMLSLRSMRTPSTCRFPSRLASCSASRSLPVVRPGTREVRLGQTRTSPTMQQTKPGQDLQAIAGPETS